MQRLRLTAKLVLLAAVVLIGCQNQNSGNTDQVIPRPVTFITLEVQHPARQSQAAGSVLAWKKETVGFDVAGRIEKVREQGDNVEGPTYDGNEALIKPGTVVARLENKRYELAVSEALAAIQESRARLKQTQAEYSRQVEVYEKGAGAKSYVDRAEADFKAAQAQLQAAQADLRQTQVDAADTLLFAPFSGLIASVEASRGAYVERGNPVASIQMMDPIKVEFAVSQDIEEKLYYNDLVQLYPAGSQEPVPGIVYLKAPTADSATRTFRVVLMVRNRLVDVGLPPHIDADAMAHTPDLLFVESLYNDGQPPFLVSVDSLLEDDEGFYVLRPKDLKIKDLAGDYNPVFKVEKVRVTPGDRYHDIVQLFFYRELDDIGDLDPATDLIVGALSGVVDDGDEVLLSRRSWLLRPGQIVRADFQYGLMNPGLYVPVRAVTKEGGGFHVFKVEKQDEARQKAVRVAVETGETVGTYIEIKPVQAEALPAGTRIVVDGAAYLRDGDPINAFIEVEEKL